MADKHDTTIKIKTEADGRGTGAGAPEPSRGLDSGKERRYTARVKKDKNIIDEILDPGDDLLGWLLAIAVFIGIGLVVLFSD